VLGRYFFPNAARAVHARAVKTDTGLLRIEELDGGLLTEAPLLAVKISGRLANLPRRLAMPNGGCFETLDNDGIDALIGEMRHLLGGGWIDRFERSWRAVVFAILFAAAMVAAYVIWGVPATALALAKATPDWLATTISTEGLKSFDQHILKDSTLTSAEQQRAQALFDSLTHAGACRNRHCELVFRQGGWIKANAFALPDGHIVLTDELFRLVKSDDELTGVFAHEMGHVVYAHGLQRIYQASVIPAFIIVVTGDVSQVSQLAVLLPTLLIETSYSREFETDADRYAIKTLRRMGKNPAAMAALLERMEKQLCGPKGCPLSWLGDHPDTARRARMMRQLP